MRVEELFDKVSSLPGIYAAFLDDTTIQIRGYNSSTDSSQIKVMMEFKKTQQDFNDIDETYWKNFEYHGPHTISKLLNYVKEYCDTPLEQRGIDLETDEKQEQYFKDNDYYVLVDGYYLLAKTPYECNIFSLINLDINDIDLIRKLDRHHYFVDNPFRFNDTEIDAYVREQPLSGDVSYERYANLESLIDAFYQHLEDLN